MTTIAHGQRLIRQLLLALQSKPVSILLHDPNQFLHSLICVLCHQDSTFTFTALDLLPILMPVLEARTREEPAEEVLVSVFKILETVLTKAKEVNCPSNSPIRCLTPHECHVTHLKFSSLYVPCLQDDESLLKCIAPS